MIIIYTTLTLLTVIASLALIGRARRLEGKLAKVTAAAGQTLQQYSSITPAPVATSSRDRKTVIAPANAKDNEQPILAAPPVHSTAQHALIFVQLGQEEQKREALKLKSERWRWLADGSKKFLGFLWTLPTYRVNYPLALLDVNFTTPWLLNLVGLTEYADQLQSYASVAWTWARLWA